MSDGRPYLSVVIPAYNEQERLASSLPAVRDYLSGARIDAEILVVDDGSTDETVHVAQEALAGFRSEVVRTAENRGKGHAVRRAVLQAAGRWVLMTDADLSTPIEEHEKLARAARDADLDVVIGSRAVAGANVEVRQNIVRVSMGKTFNGMMRMMTGLPFHDTQCGFKLMDVDRVRPLFEKMVVDRFAFDVELLYLCHRFGLAVREVPVVWRNSPASRVSMIRDPINMLFDVARIRWRFRAGAYNPREP